MYMYDKSYVSSRINDLYNKDESKMNKMKRKHKVHKCIINNWIEGKAEPSLKYIVEIAREYNVNVDYFIKNI